MQSYFKIAAVCAAVLLSAPMNAHAVSLLQATDAILAIDIDPDTPTTFAAGASSSPANNNENAPNALDQTSGTKYLNFGETGAGIIVKPNSGPSIVRSMLLTTANDAVERDPASYRLWGTNENIDIAAANHTNGLTGNWTLISVGPLSLPDDRFTPGDLVPISGPGNTGDFDGDNDADGADFLIWQRNVGRTGTGTRSNGDANGDTNVNGADLGNWRASFGETLGGAGQSYSTYRLSFPTVKNAGAANSMQIADIDFFTTADGSGNSIFAFDDPIAAIDMPAVLPGAPQSRSPANEQAPNLLDATDSTKYLNFGEENSGFIVTPGVGKTRLTSFQITTANDAVERDPTSWALYGTDAPILSTDHSRGISEAWTLIDQGTLELPDDRFTVGSEVTVNNTVAYTSYRMIFPTVKDATAANSMQIADIQFNGDLVPAAAVAGSVPEPSSACLALLAGLGLARLRRKS